MIQVVPGFTLFQGLDSSRVQIVYRIQVVPRFTLFHGLASSRVRADQGSGLDSSRVHVIPGFREFQVSNTSRVQLVLGFC